MAISIGVTDSFECALQRLSPFIVGLPGLAELIVELGMGKIGGFRNYLA